MNYIKQLQANKAEALDSARSIETAINHLISYLSCPKFHVDTRVQVGDVLRDLLPIRNDVTHMALTLSDGGIVCNGSGNLQELQNRLNTLQDFLRANTSDRMRS